MTAAHQAIDWPGIRAAAITIGVSAAARAAARNLPPDEAERFRERVAKRAVREQWITTSKTTIANHGERIAGAVPLPLSKPVQIGHEIISDTLADLSQRTRTSLANYASKAAGHAATLDPPEALERSRQVRDLVTVAAQVHGWAGEAPAAVVNIALLGGLARGEE